MVDDHETPDREEREEKERAETEGAAPAVDEDWKAEARREREKLEEKLEEKIREGAGRRVGAEMPPADLLHLVSGMAAQALMQLGVIENPLEGGEKKVDLAAARYSIDCLQMLAEKTEGNLTDEEGRYLRAALHDLRMRFVAAASPQSNKASPESGKASKEGAAG